jgi:hypothetical protein
VRPNLAGLVRTLSDYRVSFVAIGGIAVAAHGYVSARPRISTWCPTGTGTTWTGSDARS